MICLATCTTTSTSLGTWQQSTDNISSVVNGACVSVPNVRHGLMYILSFLFCSKFYVVHMVKTLVS